MKKANKIILAAALAASIASRSSAADIAALYKEAVSSWTAEQAVRLPPALTGEILKAFEQNYGAPAAKELAGKKEKVSALVVRLGTCGLTGEDLLTAEKHLDAEFRSQVRYLEQRGCREVKEAMAVSAGGVQTRPAALNEIEAASGSLGTYAGSSRFFDGARANTGAAQAVYASAASGPGTAAPRMTAVKPRPISSTVPSLSSARDTPERTAVPMPDINEYGRVHQAVNFWDAMRRENWRAYESGGLKGAAKAAALAKAALGAGFGGLLTISYLPQVETSAARLGWDRGMGAGAGTLARDAGKLAFYSGVFALALLPIPILKVARAAAAGKAWAIALLAAFAVGPANKYIVHAVDED